MSPLPPGGVELPGEDPPSPAELLSVFINDNASPRAVPAGAVVGGANDDQQEAGVASLMDAGDATRELYAPILSKRVQVRCLARTLSDADRIGNYLFQLLAGQRWLHIADSAGKVWFVHSIYCIVGPSHHQDSTETLESLFFCVITMGDEPVGELSS